MSNKNISIDKALLSVLRTGSVVIGSKRTIESAEKSEAEMVVLSANCPENVKSKINSTGIPVLNYSGTSVELGASCGKPFSIAAMAIIDPGESNILSSF